MNMIRISDVIFLAHLSSFSQLQQALHHVSPSMPTLKGDSIVLSHYHSKYGDLLEAIKEYSSLLDRDIQLMKQSGHVLFEQDEMLGNMLKR